MTNAQMRERLRTAKAYIDMTKVWRSRFLPRQKEADLEALITVLCVFVGEAEGRPTTVTKIAQHGGLSRQTIYRRLELLIDSGRVVRDGRSYYLAENAVMPDLDRR